MKKKLLTALAIVALTLSMFTSCDLTSAFATITVQVTNYNPWLVDVYYRESGSTAWETGKSLISTDETVTFDLPSSGTYDIKVQDWVSSGADYVSETFLDKDCSLDLGDVDYYISVSFSGNVSFY